MQAMSDRSLVAVSSLREFFRDAFHAGERAPASRHRRTGRAIRRQSAHHVLARRCALRENARWAAHQAARPHARRGAGCAERRGTAARTAAARRCLACSSRDSSPAASRARLIDIDYHIAMGGNAYSSLADTMQRSASGRSIAAIYAQLAQKFQRLVDALNEVSEMSYCHTDADILRLYEIWMKTGSARAHGLLNRLGVQPVKQGGLASTSTEPSMVLRGLQSLLGRLYDVRVDYDVYDFLVTDRRALAGVTPAQRPARARGGVAARGNARRRGRGAVHRPWRAAAAGAVGSAGRADRGQSRRLLHGAGRRQPFRLFDLAARTAMRRCRCSSSKPRRKWTSMRPPCFSSPISRAAAIRRTCIRGCSTASTSTRGSSPSNTTATARRTAARRTIADAWKGAS